MGSIGPLEPLPREFKICAFGVNASTKGDFVFDETAARAVLVQYQVEGVDQMIDLNHDSLNPETRRMRKDAGDAMGWYKLELRSDGLYATDVRWTPEGEERLRSKKQRYISPAFLEDPKTSQMREMVNCALVAMPAMHNAPALVAASKLTGSVRDRAERFATARGARLAR
jgi:phage I-like protein